MMISSGFSRTTQQKRADCGEDKGEKISADRWPYSSLHHYANGNPLKLLDEWPVERPADWLQFVNEAAAEAELSMLRENVLRSKPLGDEPWVAALAAGTAIHPASPRQTETENRQPAADRGGE
jgi:hypothetical protein